MKTLFQKLSTQFICVVFITSCYILNAQNVQWVRKGGVNTNVVPESMATDSAGNSYVTGWTHGAVFGSYTVTATNGFTDIFIVKYDSSGNCLWAKGAGGNGNDFGYGIAFDKQGNCYVTGEISSSTATFDSITVNGYGQADIFIAKYDTGGNCVWAKSMGGSFDDISYGISVDNTGNIYMTGRASSGFNLGGCTIFNGGIILAQFSSATGNCIWAKSFGTSGNSGNDIATDSSGNSYVTGYFQGTITMDTYTLTSNGQFDFFIAKYNNIGTCLWVKTAGGTSSDAGNAIAIDKYGNSYVTGYYYPSINFLCNSFTNTSSGYEIFTAQYDNNGNCNWADRGKYLATSGNGGWGTDIAVDADCNSYITGYIEQKFTFCTDTIISKGNRDIFIAKYSKWGGCLGALRIGGTYEDQGHNLGLDALGDIYISGEFKGLVTFGTYSLNTSTSSANMYIAKLDIDNFLPTEVVSNDVVSAINIYPNPFSAETIVEVIGSEFILYDIYGREVQRLPVTGNRLLISRGNLVAGIYFYRVRNENKIIGSGKIVIE